MKKMFLETMTCKLVSRKNAGVNNQFTIVYFSAFARNYDFLRVKNIYVIEATRNNKRNNSVLKKSKMHTLGKRKYEKRKGIFY